jgi:hypothetical protein
MKWSDKNFGIILIACVIGGVVAGFALMPDGGGIVCGGGKGCNSSAATIGGGIAVLLTMLVMRCCDDIEALWRSHTREKPPTIERKEPSSIMCKKPKPTGRKMTDAEEAARRAKFLADHEAEMARRRAMHCVEQEKREL